MGFYQSWNKLLLGVVLLSNQEKHLSESEIKKQERFPDYIYMSAFDLVRSPELILKKIQLKLEKSKTVCLDCSDYVTFKFTPKYWSFKCKCGIHLFYPPRHDRAFAYGHKFISSDEYDKTKRPR